MKMRDLTNFGRYCLNNAPPQETATIIVLGLPRSGTSMVAAALSSLGVHLGNVDSAVFEDLELSMAIDGKDRDKLAKLIELRNSKHGIWGWKRPSSYRNIETIIDMFRNPRVITIFRDVLAISMRNTISMQLDLMTMLRHDSEEYSRLVDCIRRISAPTLLVSYEKALQFPADFVAEIVSFCGLKVSEDAQNAALSSIVNGPARYINSSHLKYIGSVDRVVDNKVRGWILATNRKDIRVSVDLRIDGVKVATVKADQYRPDLEKRGMGDGKYGFVMPLPNDVDGGILSVTVCNSEIQLMNSGKAVSTYRK